MNDKQDILKDMDSREVATLRAYDNTASSWSRQHDDRNFWQEELARFHELLPKGSVLEVGTGGGRDAKLLHELGYDYFGTDISAGLLEQAQKNNPDLLFEKMSVYDLNFESKFDGFWASAVLLHIPKERIDDALVSLRRAMRKHAIGFIAIKEGSGEVMEPMGSDSDDERLFSYWRDDDFCERLAHNAFTVIDAGYRPMSERTKWLTYLVEAG